MNGKRQRDHQHVSGRLEQPVLRPEGHLGALATVDAAGKVLALRDLAKIPSKRVRGPKWFWAPVIAAVNTLGWATYFALGKKR